MANGKIVDAKFKTFGCGSAIASSSVASEWVKGKSLEEAMTIKNTDISHIALIEGKQQYGQERLRSIVSQIEELRQGQKKSEKKAK